MLCRPYTIWSRAERKKIYETVHNIDYPIHTNIRYDNGNYKSFFFQPVTGLMGPTLVTYLVSRKEDVDFSCFKSVTITGSKIFPELLAKFKV